MGIKEGKGAEEEDTGNREGGWLRNGKLRKKEKDYRWKTGIRRDRKS